MNGLRCLLILAAALVFGTLGPCHPDILCNTAGLERDAAERLASNWLRVGDAGKQQYNP